MQWLTDLFGDILCWFGIHDWTRVRSVYSRTEFCYRCLKRRLP